MTDDDRRFVCSRCGVVYEWDGTARIIECSTPGCQQAAYRERAEVRERALAATDAYLRDIARLEWIAAELAAEARIDAWLTHWQPRIEH